MVSHVSNGGHLKEVKNDDRNHYDEHEEDEEEETIKKIYKFR